MTHNFQHHMNSVSVSETALADLETLKRTFAMMHPEHTNQEIKQTNDVAGGEKKAEEQQGDVQQMDVNKEKKSEQEEEEKEEQKKQKKYRDYHQALELCLSHATFACTDVKNYTRLLLERHRKWVNEDGRDPLDITCTFCNLPHKQQQPIQTSIQQQQQVQQQVQQPPIQPRSRFPPQQQLSTRPYYSLFSRP